MATCLENAVLCVCFFPLGFESEMWNLIVLVPGHCLSFTFDKGSTILP